MIVTLAEVMLEHGACRGELADLAPAEMLVTVEGIGGRNFEAETALFAEIVIENWPWFGDNV